MGNLSNAPNIKSNPKKKTEKHPAFRPAKNFSVLMSASGILFRRSTPQSAFPSVGHFGSAVVSWKADY
jgi:hypothetical protein